MAATVSGSKTISANYSPALTGASLTTIMGIAPENWTLDQVHQLQEALSRVSGGGDMRSKIITVGSVLV